MLPDLGVSNHLDLPPIEVSTEGVDKLLSKLQPHKASGPDEVHARVLKELHSSLAPVLSDFFQRSLATGDVPEDWKNAHVAPAFKKGDKNRASNYRPISLTSIVCKILEHIIASHTMKHLEQRGTLYFLQHGFRKERSCETQLLSLHEDLTKARNDKLQTDLVVMDFAKAFDKVSHRHLTAKLDHYGIRGSTLKWITSFLANRTQRVVVEGKMSDSAPVTSGVPQGTVLGPILFLIYINDLPSRAQHSTIRLFADDCIIQKIIQTESDCAKLQEDIDSIGKWERDWLMEFHPDKCQVLSIPVNTDPITHDYNLHGTHLQRPPENSIKYLGLTIQSNLKWNQHIKNVTSKASRTLGILRRNIRVPDQDIRERAYKSLVRPQVEFGSSVWDPHPPPKREKSEIRQSMLAKQIEMVQRRGARFVCNRYHNTSSVSNMLDHLGWPSLEVRRRYFRLCMLYRIHHGIVAVPFDHLLVPLDSRSRGHDQRFTPLYYRINIYGHSFLPRTVRDWNNLGQAGQSVVGSETLDQFKSGLAKLILH